MENETPTTPAQDAPLSNNAVPGRLLEFSLPINPELIGTHLKPDNNKFYREPIWLADLVWIDTSSGLRMGIYR